MQNEEFENLTGETVSFAYYTEVIEPQYTAMCVDKAEFCATWLKENKSGICKAVAADIRRLSSTACIYNGMKSQAERAKEITAEAISERDKAQTEIHNLKYKLDDLTAKLEKIESDLETVSAERDRYFQEGDDIVRRYNDSQEELNALRAENQALKAKLYDLITAA
jgi:chromosome segregation ATPase